MIIIMQQTLPLLFNELGEEEFGKLTANAEIVKSDKFNYIILHNDETS